MCFRNCWYAAIFESMLTIQSSKQVKPQAAQTHIAREGCNVIYVNIMCSAGVALQATVENIRDFV